MKRMFGFCGVCATAGVVAAPDSDDQCCGAEKRGAGSLVPASRNFAQQVLDARFAAKHSVTLLFAGVSRRRANAWKACLQSVFACRRIFLVRHATPVMEFKQGVVGYGYAKSAPALFPFGPITEPEPPMLLLSVPPVAIGLGLGGVRPRIGCKAVDAPRPTRLSRRPGSSAQVTIRKFCRGEMRPRPRLTSGGGRGRIECETWVHQARLSSAPQRVLARRKGFRSVG